MNEMRMKRMDYKKINTSLYEACNATISCIKQWNNSSVCAELGAEGETTLKVKAGGFAVCYCSIPVHRLKQAVLITDSRW